MQRADEVLREWTKMSEELDAIKHELAATRSESELLLTQNKRVKQDFLQLLATFQDFMAKQEQKRHIMASKYKEKLRRVRMLPHASLDSENTDFSNCEPKDRIQEAIDKS